MTKVCRLCLSQLHRGSRYFNVNAVESFTGFMPYRDQLTTCIPEMALDLIPNPVICNSCRAALKSAYDFKTRCMLVEKKIREYVESQPADSTNYDLNNIDMSDIQSKIVIKQDTTGEITDESANNSGPNSSMLSELLTVRKEVILPNPKEIEITNVLATGEHEEIFSGKPLVQDEDGNFLCNICSKKFKNIMTLHQHKKMVHEEDYMCNFCSESFRSLQCLRKHNSVCSKNRNPSNQHTVLAKRPHLPTKAKNHLKRWLFRHTDHPYPTDHEKQQLMKETNLSLLQVENWFINARRRILADLTKLKNLRGRQIKRKRSKTQVEMEYDDLFETEPEDLLQDPTMSTKELVEEAEAATESIRAHSEEAVETDILPPVRIKMEIELDDR